MVTCSIICFDPEHDAVRHLDVALPQIILFNVKDRQFPGDVIIHRGNDMSLYGQLAGRETAAVYFLFYGYQQGPDYHEHREHLYRRMGFHIALI